MANKNFYLKYNLTPVKGNNSKIKDSRNAFKEAVKAMKKGVKNVNTSIGKKIKTSRKAKKKIAKGNYKQGINRAFKEYRTAPQGHQAEDSLGKIQETLDYIQSNNRTNSSVTISADLAAAMRKSIGDMAHDFAAGESNQYYEIAPDWDGKESTLINYVTWKKLPTDANAVKYLDKVSNSKWGSEKQHSDYLKTSYHQGYNTLRDKLNLNISDNIMEQLENLMYSSQMWHIVGAGNKGYDSEQGKDDWSDIFVHLDKMVTKTKGKLQQSDLNAIVQLISEAELNPDYHPHADDELTDLIDNTIKKYN